MAVYFRDTEDVIWKNSLEVIWIKPPFLQAELDVKRALTELLIGINEASLGTKETKSLMLAKENQASLKIKETKTTVSIGE